MKVLLGSAGMGSLRKHAEIQRIRMHSGETVDDFSGLNDYLGDTEFQFGRTASKFAEPRKTL